jgi:hypothetical protein
VIPPVARVSLLSAHADQHASEAIRIDGADLAIHPNCIGLPQPTLWTGTRTTAPQTLPISLQSLRGPCYHRKAGRKSGRLGVQPQSHDLIGYQ